MTGRKIAPALPASRGAAAPDALCWEVFLPTPAIQYGNLQHCQLIVLFKNIRETSPEKTLNQLNFRAAPAMT
ncbi:hypothetical protein [Burkholderia sp. Bp9140]|uniref:hypothetical protein n=1 Tax=Burkholderia sp. Bp9140 TaxID=2184572 RepID=UPI000F588B01|nr:hypothetical protein [Burkholderia sp. Bp9140]